MKPLQEKAIQQHNVVLSAMLYLNESSADICVVELVKREDGRIEERKRPQELQSNDVTVLDVYGHLYYAGARTLERLLPAVDGAENAVVILRLRGNFDHRRIDRRGS